MESKRPIESKQCTFDFASCNLSLPIQKKIQAYFLTLELSPARDNELKKRFLITLLSDLNQFKEFSEETIPYCIQKIFIQNPIFKRITQQYEDLQNILNYILENALFGMHMVLLQHQHTEAKGIYICPFQERSHYMTEDGSGDKFVITADYDAELATYTYFSAFNYHSDCKKFTTSVRDHDGRVFFDKKSMGVISEYPFEFRIFDCDDSKLTLKKTYPLGAGFFERRFIFYNNYKDVRAFHYFPENKCMVFSLTYPTMLIALNLEDGSYFHHRIKKRETYFFLLSSKAKQFEIATFHRDGRHFNIYQVDLARKKFTEKTKYYNVHTLYKRQSDLKLVATSPEYFIFNKVVAGFNQSFVYSSDNDSKDYVDSFRQENSRSKYSYSMSEPICINAKIIYLSCAIEKEEKDDGVVPKLYCRHPSQFFGELHLGTFPDVTCRILCAYATPTVFNVHKAYGNDFISCHLAYFPDPSYRIFTAKFASALPDIPIPVIGIIHDYYIDIVRTVIKPPSVIYWSHLQVALRDDFRSYLTQLKDAANTPVAELMDELRGLVCVNSKTLEGVVAKIKKMYEPLDVDLIKLLDRVPREFIDVTSRLNKMGLFVGSSLKELRREPFSLTHR